MEFNNNCLYNISLITTLFILIFVFFKEDLTIFYLGKRNNIIE
jgi:hypothetical protein